MACYHPIEAWNITPRQGDLFQPVVLSFHSPFDREDMIRQGRRLLLPCRKCVGCRLDKSREWANRILLEQLYHKDSWFVTLTYDDEHLPRSFPVDSTTGEIVSVHSSLVKFDLQKFFKRLRKNSSQQLRYYCAGEYGTQTYRPHYHCIIFGLNLNDLKLLKTNFSNQPYYTSDFISKCWPYGIHVIGKVTFESAAYVARYTMKKATHGYTKDYYDKAGIQPEFQTMSLKPGIGYQYLSDHPEIFNFKSFSVSTPSGGVKMYPPEYFRKKWNQEHLYEHVNSVINSSLENESKIHLKLLLTDKDYLDILKTEEEKRLSRISALTRDDI